MGNWSIRAQARHVIFAGFFSGVLLSSVMGCGSATANNNGPSESSLPALAFRLPSSFWQANETDAQGNLEPRYFEFTNDGGKLIAVDLCNGTPVFTASINNASSFSIVPPESSLASPDLPPDDGDGILSGTTITLQTDQKPITIQAIEEPECQDDGSGTGNEVVDPTSVRLTLPRPVLLAVAGPLSSGRQHLLDARGSKLPVAVIPVDNPKTTPKAPLTEKVNQVEQIVCDQADVQEVENKNMFNNPAIFATAEIYPGNIIRGDALASGAGFAEIGIARAPVTLTLSGGAVPKAGQSLSITVPSGSQADVADGVAQLATRIESVAANFLHEEKQVLSTSKLAFDLNVAGNYNAFSGSSFFSIDQTSKTNTVMMRFYQVVFSVAVSTPQTAYAVFENGENFEDPDNQIGPGNPPLYIKSVGYGRQIFALITSVADVSAITASANFAYDAIIKGGSVDSNLTAKNTLDQSSIRYLVLGGPSGNAAKPIAVSGAKNFVDALRDVITKDAAFVSAAKTPVVPVQFSANYLENNTPAQIATTASYVQKNCRKEPINGGYKSFSIKLEGELNDWASIIYRDSKGNEIRRRTELKASPNIGYDASLDDDIPMRDENYEITIASGCGAGHTADFHPRLYMNGNQVDSFDADGYNYFSGSSSSVTWRINRASPLGWQSLGKSHE